MNAGKKRYLFFILAVCLLMAAGTSAAAAEKISVLFENYMKIPWDWNDFRKDPAQETSMRLAVAGLILSGNAEEKEYGSRPYDKVNSAMRALGFRNIKNVFYDKDEMDRPGMSFGMSSRKINSRTVVAGVFRGTVNSTDTMTDVKAALLADGFSKAGENALEQLKIYMRSHNLNEKNTILFLTGHSYGAAVADQVGICSYQLVPDRYTYVYTYATPYYRPIIGGSVQNNMKSYANPEDVVPTTKLNVLHGKRTREFIIDRKRFSEEQYGRFQYAYYLLRGKMFSGDNVDWHEHLSYTYMALLLSSLEKKEIDDHFDWKYVKKTSAAINTCKSRSPGKAAVRWGHTGDPDGYIIYMASAKTGDYKKVREITDGGKSSYEKSGLTGGKTYWFKVRSYQTIWNIRLYSDMSAAKSVVIKKQKPSLKLSVSKATVKTGKSLTLKAVKTGISENVTWKSSDAAVASVDTKGKVTGKKKGQAVITACAGAYTARCSITVKASGSKWKTLYRKFLEQDLHTDEFTYRVSHFALYDLNGDGTPELFTRGGGQIDFTKIFTVRNNKVVMVSYSTAYGVYANGALYAFSNPGAGYGLYTYYKPDKNLNMKLRFRYAEWFFDGRYTVGEKAYESEAPEMSKTRISKKIKNVTGSGSLITMNYYTNNLQNRKNCLT